MLKENWQFISRVERVCDLLVVGLAFITAYFGRTSLLFWNERLKWGLPFAGAELAPLSQYLVVLVVALLGSLIILELMGAYSSMRLTSSWQLLKTFVFSSLIVFFLLTSVLYLIKLDLSRSFIALFCILMVLFLTLERYIVLEFLRYWRRKGLNYRNLIVCGLGKQAFRFLKEVSARPELGLRVRCFADLREKDSLSESEIEEFKVSLKKVSNQPIGKIFFGTGCLERALSEYAIDEVVFTDVISVWSKVEQSISACAEQGVRTTIVADLFSIGLVKSGLSYFGGMPLVHFQTPPGDRWELYIKRVLDILVSLLLLIVMSPLFLILALLVKLSSSGPIFFIQKRVGLNGRLFNLYKFRSMLDNAEERLQELLPLNELQGPAFKMKDDPRVTKVGAFMRRFSLDELPQLWNVLRGDMSLVGPRPPVPGEVVSYQPYYRRRLSMRPGITCVWQVSGRSNIKDFESWVKMDLDYIDNWSLFRDFKLLFRTIPAVLFGIGAR